MRTAYIFLRPIRALIICTLAGFGLCLPHAHAQSPLKLVLEQGVSEPVPIAVLDFFAADPHAADIGRQVRDVIRSDLAGTGLFRNIDTGALQNTVQGFDAVPDFFHISNSSRARALIVGETGFDADGRLRISLRLWDVLGQSQLYGGATRGDPASWRRIAHRIADDVYTSLTGEPGYFETRIVFVEETGAKTNRVKRLAVMDYDGENLRYLSDGNSLVLTPRFADNEQIFSYISYEAGTPRIYLHRFGDERTESLGRFPGMSFAPRFSPDGRSVILSLSSGANSDLYEVDLTSRKARRLTRNTGIDTAPCYSPDGSRIVFESDRGGSQQLYVMDRSGGKAKRISFGDGRYSTPVWSPRGDLIAFTRQKGGKFSIGVMRPDGGGERILTTSFLDEGPSWAPNGRRLVFFRETPGEGTPKLYTVDIANGLVQPVRTPAGASDPTWGPSMRRGN